ncbi:MAG: recombination protein RecR [Bdellovibrionales bacterium]|nr:recombination protein RecR [Bdellovibrionales bacterium]
MILKIPSLERLVNELSKLPGIGPKTAQRLAYYVLKSPETFVAGLSEALRDVKNQIHECPLCFSYTEEPDLCHFCKDPHRSDDFICVVEDAGDIARLENSGAFKGRYHVLQGSISPLDGITPQDLRIAPLIQRVKKGLSGEGPAIKEIIFALDADLEGDTTVLYVAKILRELGVATTRIAHGVPIGGDIEYVDYRTLGRALENRVQL